RQRVSARIDLHPRGTCIICALGFCPIDRESRFSTLPSHQKLIAHNRKFLWRAIPPHEPLLAHPHSDSFSTAPAPLLLQAACRPSRIKSPAWTTRCSKRPLSLPDTGSPSATMASCSSPLPDNSF